MFSDVYYTNQSLKPFKCTDIWLDLKEKHTNRFSGENAGGKTGSLTFFFVITNFEKKLCIQVAGK